MTIKAMLRYAHYALFVLATLSFGTGIPRVRLAFPLVGARLPHRGCARDAGRVRAARLR
jgi:hypothetical protein